MRKDSTRRPQRQGFPTRITHLGNPPAIHPRELPKTPALLQSVAFKTSHVCTGATVLQEQKDRNRKSMLDCGQTVEDGTSLWKAQEKWKTISRVPNPRARPHRMLLRHAEARRVRPPSTRRAWVTGSRSSPRRQSVRPRHRWRPVAGNQNRSNPTKRPAAILEL